MNEAFAAVPIAVARKLGLPDDVVNPKAARLLMATLLAQPVRCWSRGSPTR